MVLSSTFQAIRYLYPLIIVWEIFLPLFVFDWFEPAGCHESSGSSLPASKSSKFIVGFVILEQLLASSIGVGLLTGVIDSVYQPH